MLDSRYLLLCFSMIITSILYSQTKSEHVDHVLETVLDHVDHGHHHSDDYHLWERYLKRSHPNVAAVSSYFELASAEFGVPVELLKVIGQIENNWTQVGPSIDRGWGTMHLVENDYCNTLQGASDLLGVSKQTLKDDLFQNIRGAAGMLATFAGPNKASFTRIEDWFDAAKQFSGLISEELRYQQAQRYFETLKKGITSTTIWGEKVVIKPMPKIDISHHKPPTSSNQKETADYGPALANFTSCGFTSFRNTSIDTWVNHWIGVGTYAGAISWFNNCSQNGNSSAHFVIRASDGQITQVVRVAHTAWHAGASGYNNNHRSIGIEHEATTTNPGNWNDPDMLAASGTMACHFSNVYSIPKTYSLPGVRGHNDMPGTSTACPGTINWTTWWSYFNAACNGCPNNLSLTGTIANGTYTAGGTITATGVVNSGSNVSANAGNAVVLNPGFDGRPSFTAEIGGCKTSSNIPQKKNSQSSPSVEVQPAKKPE